MSQLFPYRYSDGQINYVPVSEMHVLEKIMR
jgi:hypothetical protein